MTNKNRTTQLIKLSSLETKTDSSVTYNLELSGEKAEVSPALYVIHGYLSNFFVKSSEPLYYRAPIHIHEEINVEKWKESLTNNQEQNKTLSLEILLDFGLEQSNENLDWLNDTIYNLISLFEKKYEIKLPDPTRTMVYNLLVRMAYDKLCIKNS